MLDDDLESLLRAGEQGRPVLGIGGVPATPWIAAIEPSEK